MGEPEALKPCTCHPDDNPPTPCPHKYAFRDCMAAADPSRTSPAPVAPEALERLKAFAGDTFFKGVSGKTVYPGGIFCTEGPNTFHADLRALIAAYEAEYADNFALAAGCCEHRSGDEHGNPYCLMTKGPIP